MQTNRSLIELCMLNGIDMSKIKKHINRRNYSSLSSEKLRKSDSQNSRIYTPSNLNDASCLDDSCITKSIIHNIHNEVNNEELYKHERSLNELKNYRKEVQDISTSYLEDDEDEYVPMTQRENKSHLKHQSNKEYSYKVSPMNRNSSSTQNLIHNNELNGRIKRNTVLKTKNIKQFESYSNSMNKQNNISENKRMIQNSFDSNCEIVPQNLISTNMNSDSYGEQYSNENMEHKTYQTNVFDPLQTASDNFENLAKQFETVKDKHYNLKNEKEVTNKKSRISTNEITDIIDAQTHNTFDDTYYDEKSMIMKTNNKRRDLGLDLNQTLGENIITDNKWLTAQNYENLHSSKEKSFRSNNLKNEAVDRNEIDYCDNRFEIDEYHTELRPNYDMKRIINKNQLRQEPEKSNRNQGRNNHQIKHFNTQQSLREYQPNQKQTSQSKKRKINESKDKRLNKNRSKIIDPTEHLEFDSYPVLDQNDEFLMNEDELPSKLIEKQLRTKSVENNMKSKRSRMGHYLQAIPNNKPSITNEEKYNSYNEQNRNNSNIVISNHKEFTDMDRSIEKFESKYDKTPNKRNSISQVNSTSMIQKNSSRSRANLKIK